MMRALSFSPSLPRYVFARLMGWRYPVRGLPLRLVYLPEPIPPRGFERLKVRLAGICASDLELIYGRTSPALSPFYSFPAVLGHEILAELGGVRVVVNPLLACLERGLPDCPACAKGEDHRCRNLTEGNFRSGMLGYCSDLPGGWSERIVAHRERIFPIAESVPDERAVLAEPLAVVVHGIQQALAKDWPEEILVVGGGTIGLLSIVLLRVLGFEGPIHAVVRRSHAAQWARAFGANVTYSSVREAQKAQNYQSYRGVLGRLGWRGGFGAVIEASGNPAALQEASWAVAEGGRILLLGSPGGALHDFSPYWFREVRLMGSYAYNWDAFATAVKLLPELEGIEALVGQQFGLEAWPEAIRAARRGGAKIVFKP